jgi:hypothetical protein
LFSPVPTKIRCGFEGSRAMSPMMMDGWSSKSGSKEIPLFVVFQTPPDA